MKLQEKINRRRVLQGLSLTGLGTALLSYQNCSKISFATAGTGSNSAASISGGGTTGPLSPDDCNRAWTIYDAPANVPSVAIGAISAANGKTIDVLPSASPQGQEVDHNPNAVFYSVPYFDPESNSQKTQYMLTVDVGANPAAGVYHGIQSAQNQNNTDIITDIYVVRNDTGQVILWRRLDATDTIPAGMFLIDPTLVAAGVKLTVICFCLMHGYFGQTVDLSQTPVAYSSAVPVFQNGVIFGGTNLHRPYVSVDATGTQGNLTSLHAPDFFSLSDSILQITLGPNAARHPEFGEDHYVAGGALFDQSGNCLSLFSEQSYAQATNHLLTFNVRSLAARSVTALRVVAFDTHNGMLMGFYSL